jgi:hypothetical protein
VGSQPDIHKQIELGSLCFHQGNNQFQENRRPNPALVAPDHEQTRSWRYLPSVPLAELRIAFPKGFSNPGTPSFDNFGLDSFDFPHYECGLAEAQEQMDNKVQQPAMLLDAAAAGESQKLENLSALDELFRETLA